SFTNRLFWYISGKRLKDEKEFSKVKSDRTSQQKPLKAEISQTLVFSRETSPKVTIIIPVFNNAIITYRCLKSVFSNTSEISYEVIVIDDCSTEDISLIETKPTGIRLIHNSENLGFLKSCNKSATEAKGEYFCLLYNDTEVHEGWLKHLVVLMESDSRVAVAGPKLIYPDGRLQEAGGIIWNDASAWNYGKFGDAEKPDYNYLKEVDYISGACLVIRKQVWLELNGLDIKFAPAYYEDTDLSMQVRKAGYKVIYQPLSVVTHHEGLSNGRDESAGLKKFQIINRDKFLKKWDQTLKVEHSPNGLNVFFHRDRSLHKKHLLVIDHYVPMYDQDAGSRSTFSYLKLFVKMGFKIHFIGDNYFKHEPYTTVLQQMGIEVLYGNYYKKNIRDWFRENGRYLDFVITHRVHIAPKYFEMINKFTSAKVAYIGHDLQYLGSKRKFEVTGNKKFKKESKAFLKTETWIFNAVDVILPFSTYEEAHIKKLAPDKTVQVIPVCFFENIPGKVPKFGDRRDILFVGYFRHPPNPDAILWFVNEIFPLVKKHIPEIRLHVVGSHPTKEVLKLHGDSINVTGFVSDEELINFYRSCKIAILPLRFGAGVKGKLLESLYHQVPTVITNVAAEGIPEIENYSLIADDANEFANKIIQLYNQKELWESYSANGKKFIKKYFTEKAAEKLIEQIIDEIHISKPNY
ncbi:MAG: glycosyltransferase, partial [Bacteroidales bacterium]|nr:glycosyltransferase [Bacteroidales bacterium]